MTTSPGEPPVPQSTPWITVPHAAALLRELLPAFYWIGDDAVAPVDVSSTDRVVPLQGPLDALVDALAGVFDELQDDIAQLYEDVFLETCADWLVPYFGDLVGASGIEGGYAQRRWVGRVVSLRRRKGTLSTLVRAASAATDWGVLGRPGTESVAYTPAVGNPHRSVGRTIDVREPELAERLHTPWSGVRRGVAVSGRVIAPGMPGTHRGHEPRGPLMPGTTTLDVWRLQAFGVQGRTPMRIAAASSAGSAYTFNPLGISVPLFQLPATNDDPLDTPGPAQLAMPLTPSAARAELRPDHHDRAASFRIWRRTGNARKPVPRQEIAIGDLASWDAPMSGHAVVVDPVLGRLLVRSGEAEIAAVDYAYGFSAPIGGGPYVIHSQLAPAAAPSHRLLVDSRPGAAVGPDRYPSLDAVVDLLAGPDAPRGELRIVIADSATHMPPPGTGGWTFQLGSDDVLTVEAALGAAPALIGSVHVDGAFDSAVRLRGLLIDGAVRIDGPIAASLEHLTIVPAEGRQLSLRTDRPEMLVAVQSSIVGAIAAEGPVHLEARDSIIDGLGGDAVGRIDEPLALACIERTTVFGRTSAQALDVTTSILTGEVHVSRRDEAIARYSWLPDGAHGPRRWQCQPDLAPTGLHGAARERAARRLRPVFTSERFGQPGYAQLYLVTAEEIRSGGAAGEELGVFAGLLQPDRAARLPVVVDGFIPAGQSATVRFRS